MASIITYAITGLAIGRVATARKMPRRFWVLLAILGALPDADAVGFGLGVPYGSTFGHRGFTHSLLFAALVGTATTFVAFPKERRFSREWRLAGALRPHR